MAHELIYLLRLTMRRSLEAWLFEARPFSKLLIVHHRTLIIVKILLRKWLREEDFAFSFGQHWREFPSECVKLSLLIFAKGTQLLCVDIHPRNKAIEAVGVQMHTFVPALCGEQGKQLAVAGDTTSHVGYISLKSQLLQILVCK